MSDVYREYAFELAKGYELKLAELRAALAKEKERADEWARVARERGQKLAIAGVEGSPPPGQDTTIGVLTSRLAAERQRADMWMKSDERRNLELAAERQRAERAEMNLAMDRTSYETNVDALRAECERLKAESAKWHANYSSAEEECTHERERATRLQATLAEREAEIERLKERLDEARGAFIDERADFNLAIKERDAARAALATALKARYEHRFFNTCEEMEAVFDEWEQGAQRQARNIATARAEALEEAAKVAEQRFVEFVAIDTLDTTPECDRIARRIRALKAKG